MPTLGPFELDRPFGRGGMAHVWGGRHRDHQLPVAIKVLTVAAARDEVYRAAFDTEVRAIAALSHPHIVRIRDHGEVPQAVCDQSDGLLPAGAPYQVIDRLATNLRKLLGRLDWPRCRTLLLQLLEALAHAHARNIVHRDVKPSNLLLARLDGDLVLADFGLAHLGNREERGPGAMRTAGTPSYMAPEQIRGEWRAFGPWTDLYAVGCVAWAMVTGAAPYRRADPGGILDAHLQAPLPALPPDLEVPGGLGDWLGLLLRKDPGTRYQRAADAAAALRTLPGALRVDWEAAPPVPPAPAPMPPSWRGGAPVDGTWLAGTGLELCRYRVVPLVAREAQREVLWESLVDAGHSGQARLCVLHGPSGVGKSRLARWLTERAHETGAAEVLQAVHGPGGGGADGLGPMLARSLRCLGLDGEALIEHLEDRLRAGGGPGRSMKQRPWLRSWGRPRTGWVWPSAAPASATGSWSATSVGAAVRARSCSGWTTPSGASMPWPASTSCSVRALPPVRPWWS